MKQNNHWLVMLTLFLSSWWAGAASNDHLKVQAVEAIDVREFALPLPQDTPIVDLVIHMVREAPVTWETMREQFRVAREVFLEAGVFLNLREARWISIPRDWLVVECGRDITHPLKNELLIRDLYAFIKATRDGLPEKTEAIFSAIAGQTKDAAHTVQVITLGGVSMWNPIEGDDGFVAWEKISTSAVSFPSYMYSGGLPERLAGVITFNPSDAWFKRSQGTQHKTLAHELGHKLINVSHEGAGVCPQAEVKSEVSLMVYGKSTLIGGGLEHRWHRERLHLSPFIYRLKNGKQVWNQPYQGVGAYDDPLYGRYIVRPICPE